MVGENRNEKEDWFQILCRLTMWGKSDVEALKLCPQQQLVVLLVLLSVLLMLGIMSNNCTTVRYLVHTRTAVAILQSCQICNHFLQHRTTKSTTAVVGTKQVRLRLRMDTTYSAVRRIVRFTYPVLKYLLY